MANDEMTELVLKYRDRFVFAITLLPMNNIDATLEEMDQAINDLGFRGIYIHSNINGIPLDSLEFMPIYEKRAKYNLSIYIHLWRSSSITEYPNEEWSKYMIASVSG